jgi:hypothetical protein
MSPVRFTRFNTARTLLCAVLFNVMWEGLFFSSAMHEFSYAEHDSCGPTRLLTVHILAD